MHGSLKFITFMVFLFWVIAYMHKSSTLISRADHAERSKGTWRKHQRRMCFSNKIVKKWVNYIKKCRGNLKEDPHHPARPEVTYTWVMSHQ